MDRDDGPAIEYQGPLDHFPWVDAGAVQGASKQLLKGQHTMLGVEKQCAKHLMLPVLQQGLQPLSGLCGTGDGSAFGQAFAGNLIGNTKQVLLGHGFGDDIGAGALPGFKLVVTHGGFLKKKDPGSARHTGAKCRGVVGSL